ncbi:hypothetical protein TBR22_A25840 [Luteitalea sp. TBR-22]|uniref:BatA domain-containing protein n=1 Tax=Luteitalea sp. TBR-22 TaxID=2802971 RepID=UPI001AFACC09|nr:BatA domain-containing protein [Luteitalea sp. TBR-22]BCS33357.1 hypothetical protein TBR22_A25840 [Luteitalea sp. TBR-22]
MTWAAPWAWALLVGVALPLVAHLWSRRQPTRRPFSTLRFLRAASPVSRHLRRVQDWPLLVLRTAIVAAVAAAAAGPTLMTMARLEAWRARLHRVIVVDASVAPAAAETVEQWQRTAASFELLPAAAPTQALPEAIARATSAARTGRAEIAIAWSGRATALPPRALADIPVPVGISLAPVTAAPARASGGRLTIEAAADDGPAAARLREVASTSRVRSAVRLRLWLPGTAVPAARVEAATREAVGVLDALASDPRLRAAAERSVRDARAIELAPGVRILAADAVGRPLLSGWAADSRVELALAATPGSPLALWTTALGREALERPEIDLAPVMWPAEALARATRQAQAPPVTTLPAGLDTRWCWGLALLLLLTEEWWRRRASRADGSPEVRDAA